MAKNQQSFADGPSLIGAAFTAVTAGSLAGTLINAARGMPGPRTFGLTAATMAGSMILTAAAPAVPGALCGLAGIGLSWSIFLGSVTAVFQSADRRMLGRVMSLFAAILLGGTAVGGPIAAALAASIGPRAPFLAGAGAAAAAIAITSTRRRPRHGVQPPTGSNQAST